MFGSAPKDLEELDDRVKVLQARAKAFGVITKPSDSAKRDMIENELELNRLLALRPALIERAADATKREAEQIQTAKVLAGQKYLDEQARLSELKDRTERLNAENRILTSNNPEAQRIIEQQKLVDELKKKHQELVDSYADELEVQASLNKLLEAQNELTKLKDKPTHERPLEKDQFARIGLFAGDGGSRMQNAADLTARHTGRIAQMLQAGIKLQQDVVAVAA